jgi:hypothetical protein
MEKKIASASHRIELEIETSTEAMRSFRKLCKRLKISESDGMSRLVTWCARELIDARILGSLPTNNGKEHTGRASQRMTLARG